MYDPKTLKYTKTHEWVSLEGDTAVIGISDHAQQALGDLVFLSLPEVGDTVTLGEQFSEVESVKAVSEVYSPVTGVVSEVNSELADAPGKVNEAPYEAWFIKVKDITDKAEFLTAEEYAKLED
ncbi:MAG: glycine cleavage system protein GcvH [Clostridiales bacterium]|jgi:glycine cleavage system H protein|nr:glycine cleavage system protein GcvH [Clostridiales bacterium]